MKNDLFVPPRPSNLLITASSLLENLFDCNLYPTEDYGMTPKLNEKNFVGIETAM